MAVPARDPSGGRVEQAVSDLDGAGGLAQLRRLRFGSLTMAPTLADDLHGVRDGSTPADPEAALRTAGVPAVEMRNTRTLLDAAHLVARRYWHTTPHPRMHTYRQPGVIADAPINPTVG